MASSHEFNYMPRIVDEQLRSRLSEVPAILVRGPKWCGKTSTCSQLAESALMLRDPDVYRRSVEAAEVQPSLLLRGARPRLLDEWQLIPSLWDGVTNAVDEAHGAPNQFLLTGSATPPNSGARRHTGTGRIARLDMLPMSLAESKESTGEVSLKALFLGEASVEGESSLAVEDYARLICRGGWPAPIAHGMRGALVAQDYLEAICESDLGEASASAIDPHRAHALMRALSRNISQEASRKTILEDTRNAGMGMTEPTLRVYLEALRRIFVLQEVASWAPACRSRTPLRSSPAWQLCDPSIAAAALGLDEGSLLDDLVTMGYLFESLCIRDLRVYARAIGGEVLRYRDKSGLEVDAIVRLRNGAWAGIEIKLGGGDRIEQAAANLKKLAQRVDTQASGDVAFLMVLTGGRFAYTRTDGVHVVPLGCLRA